MQITGVARDKEKQCMQKGNTIDWGQSKFEYGGDDTP
jgi:hypothetical protein